jgi:hypothetical protein
MATRQTAQRKPAMVILTEIVRVVMPARLQAPEESTPLLPVADPDATPGRGRLGLAY